MQFTKIPSQTFQNLQMNAGILVRTFDPKTGSVNESDIIGATSGGLGFNATPTFNDLGEDIDNCPKNMMELKRIESWEIKLSGTFLTITPELAKDLIAAADISEDGKVTPRMDLLMDDFKDLWWVGDYSNVNNTTETAKAGLIAIRVINALSTGGFSLQTTDKGKGQFAFEYTGHPSIATQDQVPFELFIRAGGAAAR